MRGIDQDRPPAPSDGWSVLRTLRLAVGSHARWDRVGVRHNSWRATKYYRFNGQVVAMRKNGVLTYLHGDHLGSTVLTSNSSGVFSGQDLRHAYGRQRAGTELGTENRFTGQKLDGAGLMYFNARYYDPELGHFLSPDTIVPDATNLFDYNRYMYVRGNPMKYTDPSGHCATLDNGDADWTNDGECWGLAYSIYGHGAAGANGFAQDWKINPDQWLKDIATASYATAEYLKPFQQKYHNEWCGSVGLTGQAGCGGTYVENPSPEPTSPDARVVGVGIGGSILIISAGGGIEILIHRNGEVAVYGSKSLGAGLGAGGSARLYTTTLYDLANARDYAGMATALDGTVGPLVVGTVQAPNGMNGSYYGFALGAGLSGSVVGQNAPSAYLIVNIADGTVSSPYLEETVALLSGLLR